MDHHNTCIDLSILGVSKRVAIARSRRRRKAIVYVLGVFFAFLFVGAARAQDGPGMTLQLPIREDPGCRTLQLDADGASDPTRITHNRTRGMFFPMPVARLVLCEVKELRILRRELSLVDQEIALWNRQAEFLQDQIDLAVDARNAFQTVLMAAERRARDAEERADAWYRNPILWFVIGAVITVGVLAGTTLALRKGTQELEPVKKKDPKPSPF